MKAHPQVTDTGVLLETLVSDAAPAYPASLLNPKNDLLRVTVTVRGPSRDAVTFAVGELDPNFGNHPALLALTQDGRRSSTARPRLVTDGDVKGGRYVSDIVDIYVGTRPAS